MHIIDQKLKNRGLVLPTSVPALYNYVPFVRAGHLVFIAGQIPVKDGKPLFIGKVGEGFSEEDAVKAAELCALNILTQIYTATENDWGRVKRCVRLGGFVNAVPQFTNHSVIINGASNLIVEILGEDIGKHARTSIGVSSLPLGVPVEVEAVFEIV